MYHVALAILLIWVSFFLILQISPSLFGKISRYGPKGFLHRIVYNWRFFAPSPIRHDIVILRRAVNGTDQNPDYGEWLVSSMVFGERWSDIFFNPRIRIRKTLINLCSNVLSQAENYDLTMVCNSAYAQALFSYVTSHDIQKNCTSDSSKFQFAIIKIGNARTDSKGEIRFITPPIVLS